MAYKIAIASTDGKVVNQHFGRADKFYIVQTDDVGGYAVTEIRAIPPVCQGGNHDADALARNACALSDCSYVLVSSIGAGAERALEQQGITAFTIADVIDSAVHKLQVHIEIEKLIDSFGEKGSGDAVL